MWNRKNSSVQYKEDPNNARKVNHVIDLLEIDLNSETRTYNKDGIIKRLRVNSIIEEKLFSNGWTRGKP